MIDVVAAARTWAQTWERAWPAKDVEAIAALYAEDALYRAYVFRAPDRGVEGVRDYLRRNFDVEHDIDCRFGEPVAAGDRAATECRGRILTAQTGQKCPVCGGSSSGGR